MPRCLASEPRVAHKTLANIGESMENGGKSLAECANIRMFVALPVEQRLFEAHQHGFPSLLGALRSFHGVGLLFVHHLFMVRGRRRATARPERLHSVFFSSLDFVSWLSL